MTSTSAVIGVEPGRVNSLTLVARFDEGGRLPACLQWHDLGCGSCARGTCAFTWATATSRARGRDGLLVRGGQLRAGPHRFGRAEVPAHARHRVQRDGQALGTPGIKSQIARLGRYSVSGAANGAGAGALGSAQTALG